MTVKEARYHAKAWLNRNKPLHSELKQLTDYREKLLNELGGGVASYTAKEIQRDTSKGQAHADDLRLEYSETCALIERRYAEFAKVNNETLDVIAQVEDTTQRAILTGRHVNFKMWGDVCREVNYSRANCNLKYGKALDRVFTILYGDNVNFRDYVDEITTRQIDTL